MKRFKIHLMLLVLVSSFLSAGELDFFSGINSDQKITADQEDSSNFEDENSAEVSSVWDQEVQKEDLEDMDELIPKSDQPKVQDLRIVFDDKVVGSFSDHLLTQNLKEVYGIQYHVVGELFRVSLVLDYQSLSLNKSIDNFVKPKNYDQRIAKGDRYLVAIDLMMEVFSKQDELDALYLKIMKVNNYRFWKDGDLGAKDRSIERFRSYVDASSGEKVASDFPEMIQALEEKVNQAKEKGDFKAAFQAQKSLSEIQELQKMEVGFELSPEFIGNSLRLLQSLDAISKLLTFDYTYFESIDKKSKAHLIKVGDLSKVFKMALPDFRINYVRAKNSKIHFMGMVLADNVLDLN
ncbi:hypothetical protein MJH12_08385 [bacterium]|nr:hypothetical protein [bacterium]